MSVLDSSRSSLMAPDLFLIDLVFSRQKFTCLQGFLSGIKGARGT